MITYYPIQYNLYSMPVYTTEPSYRTLKPKIQITRYFSRSIIHQLLGSSWTVVEYFLCILNSLFISVKYPSFLAFDLL